jgi:hypothetical protein
MRNFLAKVTGAISSLSSLKGLGSKSPLLPISNAEEELLRAFNRGRACTLGSERPVVGPSAEIIRSSFVKAILSKYNSGHIRGRFIEIRGAIIFGDLKFGSGEVCMPLRLTHCYFCGNVLGSQARFYEFNLEGSIVDSIDVSFSRIEGSITLSNKFEARGAVDLSGTEIRGDIDCRGGDFRVLKCNGARITGSVLLQNGFNASGEVLLQGVEISGDIDCSGGRFESRLGPALNCDYVKVVGDVIMSDEFLATGEVRFIGAKIGGQLNCQGAKFQNTNGSAFNCDSAQLNGGILLSEGFEAEGEVRLVGAQVQGQFICRGGVFKNPRSTALNFDGAQIAGDIFLDNNFYSMGTVSLIGAQIGRSLYCEGGRFLNRGEIAFLCDGVKVRNVYLRNGFSAEGDVRFVGSDIEGELICSGGSFVNPCSDALTIYNTNVGKVLALCRAENDAKFPTVFSGSIILHGSHAQQLADDNGLWAHDNISVGLDGFTYDRFADGAPTSAKDRRKWLEYQPGAHLGQGFRPQPFEQLIKVLREMGHSRDAREIGYLKEHLQLRAMKRRNPLAWLGYLIRLFFLELVLGHGYRLHRVLVPALAVLLGCFFIYAEAADQGLFAPSNPSLFLGKGFKKNCRPETGFGWTHKTCDFNKVAQEYTEFSPFAYSLDVMLPFVSLKQREDWQPIYRRMELKFPGCSNYYLPEWFLRGLVWFEAIFAWICTLSLSAFATGIVKRD